MEKNNETKSKGNVMRNVENKENRNQRSHKRGIGVEGAIVEVKEGQVKIIGIQEEQNELNKSHMVIASLECAPNNPMRIMVWNCKGMGGPSTIAQLKESIRLHLRDVVFVWETKRARGFMGTV